MMMASKIIFCSHPPFYSSNFHFIEQLALRDEQFYLNKFELDYHKTQSFK